MINDRPSTPSGLQTIAARESLLLAPYAMRSVDSRGRKYPEPDHPYRGPFQRDRDRIMHSKAFRRLKHKTQVFVNPEGDHYVTRLTHTIQVTQIARSLAAALSLNEPLAEASQVSYTITGGWDEPVIEPVEVKGAGGKTIE